MPQFLQTLKKPISRKLDALGMYRVVSGGLLILAIISIGFGFLGLVPYTGIEQILSLLVTVSVALIANYSLAYVFRVHANHESALITALIIFFLILPAQLSSLQYSFIIALVTLFAVLSKFLLVWRKQHIFNPVATGLLAVTILYTFFSLPPGYFESAWWVGQPSLFIPLVLIGAAVVSKVRKWTPVLSFLGIAYVVYLYEEWQFTGEAFATWEGFWLSGPSVFLAAFMLTEPFTMPPTKNTQRWYGAIVGFLSQTTLLSPVLKMSPELALILGNAYAYLFRIRRKLFLTLISKKEIAEDIWEFTFQKPAGFTFEAGQYLEWMLPHKQSDSRGERRYFTIASSPTEDVIRLAFKYVAGGSSYKNALLNLEPGQQIIASQLAGDFLLPKDRSQKLGFIAGGIGVTPFSSHVSFMRDAGRSHDIKLFYCVNNSAELAFSDQFSNAPNSHTFELIPVVAKESASYPAEEGFVTKDMLKKRVPDYRDRHWYLSGPPPMVNAYDALLRECGVKGVQITKDFFPGLA